MKKTLLIGGLAALTLGGVAVAQQSAPQAAPQPAQRMARADSDGDGRLSQGEFVARRVERLRARDMNGDGVIAPDERPTRAKRGGRGGGDRNAVFDRLDANRDGALSREEFAARPERAGRRTMAVSGAAGPADVGLGEMQGRGAGRTINLAEAETKLGQRFARLDANGDGYLTAEEQPQRGDRAGRRAERRAARQAQQASPQPMSSE